MKEDKTEFTNKMNDEIKKSFQVPQDWSKIPNKSITFDYEAQQNLPQLVKDKMKKDRLNCDLSTKANNETLTLIAFTLTFWAIVRLYLEVQEIKRKND